ncbi:MAG: hypothetical protein UV64_C0001G0048 [Parcubacteria group bacterium GW2011_GWC1_43_11b]|nr:MAG: hypothetical protein UV64_C0001G0048 [Parcubacteria group bacterium GW2011_GWC1_43_11b]
MNPVRNRDRCESLETNNFQIDYQKLFYTEDDREIAICF